MPELYTGDLLAHVDHALTARREARGAREFVVLTCRTCGQLVHERKLVRASATATPSYLCRRKSDASDRASANTIKSAGGRGGTIV